MQMRRDFAETLLVGEPTATILGGNGCKTTIRFNGGGGHMVKTPASKSKWSPSKTGDITASST